MLGAIDVVTLTPELEAAYQRFLLDDPRTLVYATIAFRDFLVRAAGGEAETLLALRDGGIVGSLPYLVDRDPKLGAVVNSLPWYGSHGGCILGAGESEARTALLLAFHGVLRDDSLLTGTVVLTPFEEPERARYEAVLRPETLDSRIGQMTALPPDGPELEAELERRLRQKTRNLVRKARRQGFEEVVTDEPWGWEFLERTHAAGMAAMGGRAKPPEHFAALRDSLPGEWRRLSVALLDGHPVAALLLVRFNKTVEYLTPVVEVEHRPRQPLSFLIWNAMLDAARTGYATWNWGGTWHAQDSLHHFKAGWGADDLPYSYLVCASDEALARLRERRDEVLQRFPYYYLYPFAQLG
jgi:hypothetical protein